MEREEAELRTTRTSEATAEVTAFADDAALLHAMFAAVSARVAAAIAHRQWIGLLSRRGDAAAVLFLDGERIDGLLAGPATAPPAEVVAAATQAEHAIVVLGARVAATDEAAGPLARALRRWELDPDSTLLLGALLAAELSPRLARVLAYLGGDSSRPGVTVDAAAALFGDGVPGALIVDARIGRGAPLFDLGLVAARPIDQPLLRRTLGLAPRVAQLARGELALDPALAHVLTPATPAALATSEAIEARIAAVLRAAPPVLGMVRATREASPAERIAQVAARHAVALWQIDVRALADEGIERAILREALLFGAALLIRIDPPGPGRESWRVIKLIDRLAACVPTFVDADDRADLEPLWSSSVVPIELPALGAQERVAVWTEALGPSARFADLERARRVKLPVAAMRRTATALAALSGAGAGVPLLSLTIAQVMREPALPRVAPRALDELVLAAPLRERVVTVCDLARRSERTIVAIIGRAGSGKSALAAAIAGTLETAAVVLDFAGLVGRPGELDRGLTELFTFAAAGGTAILDAGDAIPQRRGLPTAPEVDLLGRRLATATGVVVLLVRESVTIDPVVRRWISEIIELPALDGPGREAIWRRALAGSRDPIAAARALCELPLSAEQIFRFAERALLGGATAPEALRAEVLRLVRDTGGA
jgi:hypothetical protein